MNLRDKLRAVDRPKAAPSPGAAVPTACWEKQISRPAGEFPEAAAVTSELLSLMTDQPIPHPFDPTRILFLDTETTGLGGGAGTLAFEIGIGHLLADGSFSVRQLVMLDYPQEASMLARLQELSAPFDMLCTFNGSTFDLPLLESRFRMNRMQPVCLQKPHIDLLHLSRRLWKLRLGSCRLSRLEEVILGQARTDDLPGSEAPKRFFDYLRTSRFDLLDDVLLHNEQDIASLCVLLGRMCAMIAAPERIRENADLLSLGRAMEKTRHTEQAKVCYRLIPSGAYRTAAQLRLAAVHRREGQVDAACQVWQSMTRRGEGGILPYVELAKLAEHRLHDIPLAIAWTEKALRKLAEPSLRPTEAVQSDRDALQYRYARLLRRRKL